MWDIGWEAVSAIVGVISLVLMLVLEWDRLREPLGELGWFFGCLVGMTFASHLFYVGLSAVLKTLSEWISGTEEYSGFVEIIAPIVGIYIIWKLLEEYYPDLANNGSFIGSALGVAIYYYSGPG